MGASRAVLTVVGLAILIGMAGASSVRAAEPELGASIQSVVYVREDPTIKVWNRSTIEALFTVTPSGGWTVDRDTLTLAPDEQTSVRVTGTGDDGAGIAVRIVATGPTPQGAQRSELLLGARVFFTRPFDWQRVLIVAMFALVAIVAAILILRRLRPWELRLARSR